MVFIIQINENFMKIQKILTVVWRMLTLQTISHEHRNYHENLFKVALPNGAILS